MPAKDDSPPMRGETLRYYLYGLSARTVCVQEEIMGRFQTLFIVLDERSYQEDIESKFRSRIEQILTLNQIWL